METRQNCVLLIGPSFEKNKLHPIPVLLHFNKLIFQNNSSPNSLHQFHFTEFSLGSQYNSVIEFGN